MKKEKFSLNQSGLTLVELIIVMALSLFLMAAVYLAYQTQHRTTIGQHQITSMQQDLRAVLDIVERDIRMAGCDVTDPGTLAGISVSSGVNFISVQGMDETGSIQNVSYTLNGESLERNGISLVTNCTSLGFSYLDADGNTINPSGTGGTLTNDQADAVRMIRVNIRVQTEKVDPDTGQFLSRSLARRVRCRNMELNVD